MAEICALAYYPVKGCAATYVSTAHVGAAGLAHDRSFMVVADDGTYRTQRHVPELAAVRPEIDAGGGHLTLRAPGAETLDVDVYTGPERRGVTLFGQPFPAIDQGEAVAQWLSDFLGLSSRLVRVPPEHDRVADGHTPGASGFADSNALLVTSTSSLDELNKRIVDAGREPVPMWRFRPNLVVDGWDEPHTEDLVRSMTVGTAAFGYAKPAIRCVVTTVDQLTGARVGPEPLRTLALYRRATDGGVAFGMKASVVQTGRVSVGEPVTVTAWGVPEV